MKTPDYSNPMLPDVDEEERRRRQMDTAPKTQEHDEEADRIRRLKGGGGMGGET